jgi:DNA-binding NarL/FixJ family response regulator
MVPVSQPSSPAVSVLIVDDHRIFADVLTMRLRADPHNDRVEPAYSLPAAAAVANRLRPEVVLLDYDVDGVCGLELLDQLRRLPTPPPVLVLSGSNDPLDMIAALEAGALGWVTKDASFEELLDAALAVVDGRLHLPKSSLKAVVDGLLTQARGQEVRGGLLSQLTERQVEVLRCLVSGMTRPQVAERLFLSTNTVRTHVQNMLHQLELHSTHALVAAALRAGVEGIDTAGEAGPAGLATRAWSE